MNISTSQSQVKVDTQMGEEPAQEEKLIVTESTAVEVNVIGNEESMVNDQSVASTQGTPVKEQPMLSRKRAKALAKQLAAAGIEEAH